MGTRFLAIRYEYYKYEMNSAALSWNQRHRYAIIVLFSWNTG